MGIFYLQKSVGLLGIFHLHLSAPNPLQLTATVELLFYFSIYSCMGWLLENVYSFFTKGVFFKEGFWKGPFKPMYGFSPVLLLIFISYLNHWGIVLLLCLVVPTLVEYGSGWMSVKFFGKRWWDYTEIPMQLGGHICIPFSLCWLFLSFIGLKYIHPGLVSLFAVIKVHWTAITPIIIVYFMAELFFAIERNLLKEGVTEVPGESQ